MRKLGYSLLKFGALANKSHSLININTKSLINYFSTLKSDKNPNQIPEQVKRMMQGQKQKKKPQQLPILKDISQLKNIEQLPQIYKKLVFMTKQNRQIAIRYLLSAIYQGNIPFEAIQQRTLQVNLKQYPYLKLQTEIFQINYYVHKIQKINKILTNQVQQKSDTDEKQKQLPQLFNKINNMYYHSFNITLKTISSEHLPKSRATLYKQFAQYNFEYLFDPKITDRNSSLFDSNLTLLKKAREFLLQSLNCHKQILLNEHKRLQSDEMKNLKQQNSQRHQIKLNAIKQNIRKIVQSIGQCLYAIFKVLNKQNRILKDPKQHKYRKIQLLSLIDTYIPLYSVIPGIKQLSMMYYKLYKIKIQAKFTSVGQPKNQQQLKAKIKETVQEYSRLYRQCQDCLDQSIKMDNFNNIKDISTTMISIKYMVGRTVKKTEKQLRNSLAQQAKFIIDKVKKQFKQPIQQYLLEMIKEMLNVKS